MNQEESEKLIIIFSGRSYSRLFQTMVRDISYHQKALCTKPVTHIACRE